ncbi:MAG: type II toxin-antitoxin system PemK/MazF family toxin [Clostridia bacterium]|nr:type II toxin-antitoxin system PemK/MazF family toxin [Clostridia bacterium]
MSYNAWEVWAAEVKFEDSPIVKSRPVLILEDKTTYAICLKMTGTSRPGDYDLKDWAVVGLKKPTTVRIRKILQLYPHDLKYKIGDLSPLDIANIQSMIVR